EVRAGVGLDHVVEEALGRRALGLERVGRRVERARDLPGEAAEEADRDEEDGGGFHGNHPWSRTTRGRRNSSAAIRRSRSGAPAPSAMSSPFPRATSTAARSPSLPSRISRSG